MLQRNKVLAIATTLLMVTSASAAAQYPDKPDYHFAVTPYMWFSSLDGDVGVRAVSTNVSLSSADILDILKFGVMLNGEAHKRPYVGAIDGIYTSVGDGRVFAFRGDTGSLHLDQEQWIVHGQAGLMYGDDVAGFDLLGGLRFWDVSAKLNVDAPRVAAERSGSRSWVDATGGVRGHVAPGWFRFDGEVDGGGGGSRGSWQAYGALGGTVYGHWTGRIGYRWLTVNYDHDNFLYDTTMQGVIFSVSFGF